MYDAEKIKRLINADPDVVGSDFHAKLAQKLEKALASQGISLQQAQSAIALDPRSNDPGSQGAISDDFASLADEMERHISLNAEYEVTSRLGGVAGAVHKFVKKVVMALKLKTDVQVHQQAQFNMAVFVHSQISIACLDLLQKKLICIENKHAAAIEELKTEMARLKEKTDAS